MIMILFKNIIFIKNMTNIKWVENIDDNDFIKKNIVVIKNMTNIKWVENMADNDFIQKYNFHQKYDKHQVGGEHTAKCLTLKHDKYLIIDYHLVKYLEENISENCDHHKNDKYQVG